MKRFLLILIATLTAFAQSNVGVTYNTATKQVSPASLKLVTATALDDPTTSLGLATKQYVDARARQVATVAAMQALTGLANNDVIITAGRTTAGDGGGATFYYSSGSSSTTNLGTIFTATGMGTGRLVWNGTGDLNVRMFDARGDAVTDDTASFNAALAFAKVSSVNGNHNQFVRVPSGNFLLSANLHLPENTILSGYAPRAAGAAGVTLGGRLLFSGSNYQAVTMDYGAQFTGLKIESQTYQDSNQTGSFGIRLGNNATGMLTDSGLNTIEDVWITGFATSMGDGGSTCFNNYIDRIHLDGFSRQAMGFTAGGTAWKVGAIYAQNLNAATGVTTTGTITAAVATNNTITLTLSSLPTILQVGMFPALTGLTPTTYNSIFCVTAITGSGPYTVTLNSSSPLGTITGVTNALLTQYAMPCVGPVVSLAGDMTIQSLDVEWVYSTNSILVNSSMFGTIDNLYFEQCYGQDLTRPFAKLNSGFQSMTIGSAKTVNMGLPDNMSGYMFQTVGYGTLVVNGMIVRDTYHGGTNSTEYVSIGRHAGTMLNATTTASALTLGQTVIPLATAGTGKMVTYGMFQIAGDPNVYQATTVTIPGPNPTAGDTLTIDAPGILVAQAGATVRAVTEKLIKPVVAEPTSYPSSHGGVSTYSVRGGWTPLVVPGTAPTVTVSASGNQTNDAALSVTGTLTAAGAATVGTTLGVTGAVTGASSIAGLSLYATNATTSGTLAVGATGSGTVATITGGSGGADILQLIRSGQPTFGFRSSSGLIIYENTAGRRLTTTWDNSGASTLTLGSTGNASPADSYLTGEYGSGADIAAKDLYIYSGRGTGAGSTASSRIRFYTPTAGTNSSTAQTMTERMRITSSGTLIGIGGTATTQIKHGISGNLVLGVLVVSDSTVTANTRIFLTTHVRGTITLPATYDAATRTPGVSFTITSSNVADTSTVEYLMIEP